MGDIRSDGYGGGTVFSHITVSFLEDNGDRDAFLAYLNASVKTGLQERIENETLVNWSLFEEVATGEAEEPSSRQYALVARYHGFEDLASLPVDERLRTHLVREQALALVDIVEAGDRLSVDRNRCDTAKPARTGLRKPKLVLAPRDRMQAWAWPGHNPPISGSRPKCDASSGLPRSLPLATEFGLSCNERHSIEPGNVCLKEPDA